MALIHKITFEIIQGYNREDSGTDDYFEVDDLIALTISILNKKGYTTTFCCSGHPFINLSEAFADNSDALNGIPGMQEILENTNPEFKHKYVGKFTMSDVYCYIAFAEPVHFDALPDGFVLDKDDKCLTKDFSQKPGKWACINEIVENMKQLYLWATALPDDNG